MGCDMNGSQLPDSMLARLAALEARLADEEAEADRRRAKYESSRKAKGSRRRDRPLCGARTRAGGACAAKVVPGKRRCRLHGGLSTGPKTPEGRARALAALAKGVRRRSLKSLPGAAN